MVEGAFGLVERRARVRRRVGAPATGNRSIDTNQFIVGSGAPLAEVKIAARTARCAKEPILAGASSPPRDLAFTAMACRVAEEIGELAAAVRQGAAVLVVVGDAQAASAIALAGAAA